MRPERRRQLDGSQRRRRRMTITTHVRAGDGVLIDPNGRGGTMDPNG
jgi:hypothetical protein